MSRRCQPWAEALAAFLARTYPDAPAGDLWTLIPEDGLEVMDADGCRWIVTVEDDPDDPGDDRLFGYPLDPMIEAGPSFRSFRRHVAAARKAFSGQADDSLLPNDRERRDEPLWTTPC